MTDKPLAEMTYTELHAELHAATQAVQAAEYQDGLANYIAAKDAAVSRKRAVEVEIDRRLDALRVDGHEGGNHGE